MVWFSNHPQFEQAVLQARNGYAASGLLVITGPSGTGKSFLAKRIHEFCRPDTPFLVQGAAALDSGRFESQLFGHEKGAFSGATQNFSGLLGGTGKGTLCLEGLEDLDTHNQAKMLRFLQSGMYRGVGAVGERKFFGGLILTSRYGLRDALERGVLREDFYFRIMGRELSLPSLTERPMDLDVLISDLSIQIRAEVPLAEREPTDEDRRRLAESPLEGNLHRLRNLLQQSMIRNEAVPVVSPAPAGGESADLPDTGALKSDLAQLEKRLLERALAQFPYSRKELAAHLGISVRSLMYKLRDHGLNN